MNVLLTMGLTYSPTLHELHHTKKAWELKILP